MSNANKQSAWRQEPRGRCHPHFGFDICIITGVLLLFLRPLCVRLRLCGWSLSGTLGLLIVLPSARSNSVESLVIRC